MRWVYSGDGKCTNSIGKDFLKRVLTGGPEPLTTPVRYKAAAGHKAELQFIRRTYNDRETWNVRCVVTPAKFTKSHEILVRPLLTARGITAAVESAVASKDVEASHCLGGEAFLNIFQDCGSVVFLQGGSVNGRT